MKTKNRGWVKNAAIIFLSVLLVLTFFSNTILNYSLPEVAGQSVNGGEIATAVRGTGTVTANEGYNIEMEETRQIKSVLVRVGDIVEAGQVLVLLEDVESDELKAELDKLKTETNTLDTMKYEYNKALLGLSSGDYDSDNMAIQRMQEDLQDAIDERDKIGHYSQLLDQAKAAVRAAQDVVDALTEEAEELKVKIEEIVTEIDEDLLTGEMKELRNARDAAAEVLADRKKDLEKAQKALTEAEADTTTGDTSALQQKVIDQIKVVNNAQNDVTAKSNAFIAAMKAAYETGGGVHADAPQKYKDYFNAPEEDKAEKLQALYDSSIHSGAVLTALQAVYTAEEALMNQQTVLANYENDLYRAQSGTKNLTPYKEAVKSAEKKVEAAQEALDKAEKAFNDATKDLKVEGKEEKQALNDQLKAKNNELKNAQRTLDDAKAAQTEAEADAALKPEEAEEKIKSMQRSLEDKLLELAKKKDESSQARDLQNLELAQSRKAITDQEELIAQQEALIAELQEKGIGTEITARYGGTILSLGGIAGDKINKGDTIASIEVEGKGFTLSFSVSNDESRRVKIGETTVISSYWGEDTVCTLVAIKNDKDNPGRKKLLEFEVKGDVQTGQTLNLVLGERTAYYETVVPNSAVREDQNGKFILIAEQKSTPLGNRYIAQRMDVEVLAKDSTNSAISGAYEWGTYIITTATKPVEPGTQVRLIGA